MATNAQRNLVEYFKKNIKKGYTLNSLKWALVNQGYSKFLIDLAAKEFQEELAREAPVLKTKPEINMHLVDDKLNEFPVERKKSFLKKIFGIFE